MDTKLLPTERYVRKLDDPTQPFDVPAEFRDQVPLGQFVEFAPGSHGDPRPFVNEARFHPSRVRIYPQDPRWYHHLGAGTILALMFAVLVFVIGLDRYSVQHTVIGTVCSEQIMPNGGGGTFMVFATSGVYQVSDHVVDGGRSTSSNVYAQIVPYAEYQITYYGFRNGVLGLWQNIIKVKLLSGNLTQGRNTCLGSANP
jgi:hypothetical protein